MASDEVVKWAGAFSPRLFTKDNSTIAGNEGDNPDYALLNSTEEYAYIGVYFNHNPDVPSNDIQYVYEVKLEPGQSGEGIFRDVFDNNTETEKEKLRYLENHCTDVHSDDEYDVIRIRRAAGIAFDVPIGSRTTVDSLLGNL